MARAFGLGSLNSLRKEPHGRLLEPHKGGDFLGKRVVTDDGLVDLAPAELVEAARKLGSVFEQERVQRDGRKAGVESGAMVEVRSGVASVRVPVQLTDEMMPGAVALPHGWGHQAADGLSVASRTTGANVNLLAADGPDELEYFSGMAKLNGIWVDVVPVD
jgi:hypothetical protein